MGCLCFQFLIIMSCKMKQSMAWQYENIKGKSLQFIIKREITNKGLCEEYIVMDQTQNTLRCIVHLCVIVGCITTILFMLQLNNVLNIMSSAIISLFIITRALLRVFKEAVLYVPNVGMQQTTFFACGLQSPNFIPSSNITDIIINEDIGWCHSFYLAVVLKNANLQHKLCPLFSHLKPRLKFLQEVHTGNPQPYTLYNMHC
ncbi:hypothetical protein B566_EDAN015150 [Ephemera danica]|nr:hypothetical protein B566_EDAN015150 [Ephemera danica]